jgi:hypothetical protein
LNNYTTKLDLQDKLPLTCSRTGTCCFGKQVLLNPWELACIANAKKITPKEFRDTYCEFGGIRLRFDGENGWKKQKACSQYVNGFGCSVHVGRPLSCRLNPLGRQIQSGEIYYMHLGNEFPCLDGCPEVLGLPYLNVREYLEGQVTEKFEKAQDEYLNLMQNIADIAFELLLETGLAESGDKDTLRLWRVMGSEQPNILAGRIGAEWMDCLMLPAIEADVNDPISFIQKHNELLQEKIQSEFGTLKLNRELHEASVLIMGVALQLARGIGANAQELAELWIDIAKSHGAQE